MKQITLRALRRHHRERVKRKRLRGAAWMRELDPGRIGKYIDTPHPCSCYCCGNPRRHFGKPTIQERKQDRAENAILIKILPKLIEDSLQEQPSTDWRAHLQSL